MNQANKQHWLIALFYALFMCPYKAMNNDRLMNEFKYLSVCLHLGYKVHQDNWHIRRARKQIFKELETVKKLMVERNIRIH